MVSLADIRRLLGFSDHRQRECERGLDKALRTLVLLEGELQAVEQQTHGLDELLISQRPENQRLSHAQLLALLRRQAVIRRQIGNLALERIRLMDQRQEVAQGVERLQQHRKALQRKHLKYLRLEQRLLGERRSRRWRDEENDIDELLVICK
ncbi:protein SpaM [Pseudomonas sp. NPDC089392]|uniref:protein SpaM n=1 Tax=Pseudomonas sp. NPDC089392 TaxID=3364459 RepID=UPI0037FA92EE